MSEPEDSIQRGLAKYAVGLNYQALTKPAIHAAKVRVIDTLGVLISGFDGNPGRTLRNFAATLPVPSGSSIIGTTQKVAPDLAAYVNATTMRYSEFNDLNHWPGSYHAHPSDMILPLLAIAEYAHVSGQVLIASTVLAYEVYQEIAAAMRNYMFDHTNLCCIGTAVGAGKILALDEEQLAHCISMAVVPNIILTQTRRDQKTSYKVASSGHAGRAGVFAAQLAKAGLDGPNLPFEGGAGWSANVAGGPFSLGKMGGGDTPFKILDTRLRFRPSMGETHSSAYAAEKIAPKLKSIAAIKKVTVEVYKRAREMVANRDLEWCWDPHTRESANNSLPYVVAVILKDGQLNLASFDEAHLQDPALRALLAKVEVVENEEYTKAFDRADVRENAALAGYPRLAREHLTRITVEVEGGEKFVAESGADLDDISVEKPDSYVEKKFRELAGERLDKAKIDSILGSLWALEDIQDVAVLPREFVFN